MNQDLKQIKHNIIQEKKGVLSILFIHLSVIIITIISIM